MAMWILFAVYGSASLLTESASSLDLKDRPVTKVIKMLQEMQAQLTKEKDTDQELYDKLTCWCETNGGNKKAAIATATAMIEGLESDIEGLTSKSAQLQEQIASLEDEVAKNDAALRKADAMRQKDLAEFNEDEKDLIKSISSLNGAVTALSKHHSAFLQLGSSVKISHLISPRMVERAGLTAAQRRQVAEFLQQPAGFQSYAPASGQIFGILEQMKETFETNLAEAQKEEQQSVADFEQVKAGKLAEIASGQKMIDSKTQELAQTEEDLAAAKQNLSDTKDALSADQKFIADLKVRCANADEEFESRSKARNLELQGVAETIAILNSDEAHEMFSKTVSFVQVKASAERSRRSKAAAALRKVAKRTGSEMLLALASTVTLEAFKEVKEKIEEMMEELKQQQKDDVKQKDFCVAEFNENEKQTVLAQDTMSDLTTEIETLTATLDTLKKEIKAADAEIADTKVQMTRASEDREAENAEFQQTVSDQRAAQQILMLALNRMKEVYGFAQVRASAPTDPGAEAPPPPEDFKEYKQSEGGNGVIGMIQSVIDESKETETDAIRSEQDASASYEEFLKNANKSIKALMKSVMDKKEKAATADARLIRAKAEHVQTMKDLESLNEYKGQLHKSCDFLMKNFDEIQEKRGEEIEALRQATSILSGA
jgi:chromosome segregation ATPase